MKGRAHFTQMFGGVLVVKLTYSIIILLVVLYEGAHGEYVPNGRTVPQSTQLVPGNVKFAVNDVAIAPILPMILRLLNNYIGNITVPEQSLRGVQLEEMQVQDIHIGNMTLHMSGTNRVDISMSSIKASVPETIFRYNLALLSCSGTAKTEVRNAGASFALRLSAGAGDASEVLVEDMTIRLLDVVITPSMNGWCKSMDFVVATLMGIFKQGIVDYLQRLVPAMVEPIVKARSVEMLHALPITFVGPPNITEGRMELMLVIHPEGQVYRPERVWEFTELVQPLPERDISIVCSFVAVSNALRFINAVGKQGPFNISIPLPMVYNSSLAEPMYPDVMELCSDCPLHFVFGWTTAPWLTRAEEDTFVVNMHEFTASLDIVMDNSTSIALFGTRMNGSIGMTRLSTTNEGRVALGIASFSVDIVPYTSLDRTINITSLSEDAKTLLNTFVAPLINAQERGFPLPFYVADPLLKVSNGTVIIGLNAMENYPLISSFVDSKW